eukprot:3166061-Prymnesium_polylepis.1
MGRRKREDREYETYEGAGASASLRLELAPGSRSGYVGVRRSGQKWMARFHVGASKWRYIGTYETPQEAAVQVALATSGERT